MWSALESARVDLVILDVMLPGDDGFVLCRNLRARGNWPVIMLTAKDEEMDRIVGLELGADDYLSKPFNPRELLARIKSVLRRHRAVPGNLQPEDARSLRFADWTLDLSSRNLISPQQVVVALSGAEFRLAARFPVVSQSRAVPRPADGSHCRPRSRPAGSQRRRSGEPSAAAAGRRCARARDHQDRTGGRVCAGGHVQSQ